jgi:hypothetical protein
VVEQTDLAAKIPGLHEIEADFPPVDGKVHALQAALEQKAQGLFTHSCSQHYAASGELAQAGKRGELAEKVGWQRLENGESA